MIRKSASNRLVALIGTMIGLCCTFSVNSSQLASKQAPYLKRERYSLQGTFLSLYTGGVWGRTNVNTNVGGLTDTSYFATIANIDSVNHNGSRNINTKAFTGGIQLNKNWSLNEYFYGAVLDFGSFHLNNYNYANNIPYPTYPAQYNLKTSMNTDWIFSARGRVGVTPKVSWPYIFATTGVALTELHVSNAFSDTDSAPWKPKAHSNTKIAWVLGGGLELPITKKLTLSGEYLYINFGSTSVFNSINGTGNSTGFISPFVTSTNLVANIFKANISYKL